MISSDRGQITIPAKNGDIELGIGEFQPGREWNRSSMSRMVRIDVHIAGNTTRAAYARDHNLLILIDTRVQDGVSVTAHGDADPATRAPDMRHPIGANDVVQWVRVNKSDITHDQPPV
jgi:hypothetical protein